MSRITQGDKTVNQLSPGLSFLGIQVMLAFPGLGMETTAGEPPGEEPSPVAGSVVPTLGSEYKPQPTTAPGVWWPVRVSRRGRRNAVSTLEPPFGFQSGNSGIPMPLSTQSPGLTPARW